MINQSQVYGTNDRPFRAMKNNEGQTKASALHAKSKAEPAPNRHYPARKNGRKARKRAEV